MRPALSMETFACHDGIIASNAFSIGISLCSRTSERGYTGCFCKECASYRNRAISDSLLAKSAKECASLKVRAWIVLTLEQRGGKAFAYHHPLGNSDDYQNKGLQTGQFV